MKMESYYGIKLIDSGVYAFFSAQLLIHHGGQNMVNCDNLEESDPLTLHWTQHNF